MSEASRIARLVASTPLSPEIKHFVFEVPEIETLEFLPGQFVSFTEELKGKRVTRAYSIASRPEANRFELCLNLVDDGHFSPHLFAMKPGDTVPMKGPLGTFTLREPVRDSIMVATGTGIAPFRGMLREILARDSVHQFTLVFGARYEHGLVFADEFSELASRHANFRFVPTVTRPGDAWNGPVGRVQPLLIEALGERRDFQVYACGLKAMVEDVRAILKERGYERKQFVSEKYD
ncbi:MAG: hypothetical protein K2Q23_19825 [Bryobacteraceae bacterium]|nr:hypothetical protein [Bryobacteraceae bacterium]